MDFSVEQKQFKLEDNPTVLIAGYTGCGKSYLLKEIYNQLKSQDLKFLFIDLKAVEWSGISDKNQIQPVIIDVNKVDRALDLAFSREHNKPLIVIWDTIDDYMNLPGSFETLKKLLSGGPGKQIYTFATTSRSDAGLENLFNLKIIGAWNPESLDILNKDETKNFVDIDIENLPTGKFILTS